MDITPIEQQDQISLNRFSVCLQHESWTHQQLEEYQAQALRACREYAYAHSPFYQRFHQGFMDRPLQELPVLTKAMMMEHFDELVTDRAIRLQDVQQYLMRTDARPLFLDRYQLAGTSGSSGQPAVFLSNPEEVAIMGNTFLRSASWGGITPASRAAVVTTADPAHLTSQAPITNDRQSTERLQLSCVDPLETIVQRLNEWQPDVLLTYSSMGSLLANEQRQGRLHITLRSIFCGSETLTSETRRRIEEAWQVKLFDVYGTTEGGLVATECSSHQGLHLFEDFSLVEIVDQDNRPVPPGEQGEKVLLTVLFRRTQPLIRYELNDLVRPSRIEQCSCGRPFTLLESIEGRTTEMLYFSSPTGKIEKVHPYLFLTVFDTLPLSGWQVIHELDGLHIFLTGAPDTLRDADILDPLRQALSRRGVLLPAMQIHRVVALTRTSGGKAPMIISRVSHNTI